MNYLSFKWWKR